MKPTDAGDALIYDVIPEQEAIEAYRQTKGDAAPLQQLLIHIQLLRLLMKKNLYLQTRQMGHVAEIGRGGYQIKSGSVLLTN